MRLQGGIPDDLALANEITLNPGRVTVRGPESRVLGLDSIRLEPFDLSNVTESGIFTVQVDSSGLAGGSVVPATATIAVRVEEVVERLLGVPVGVDPGGGEAALVSDPLTIQVRLSGARTLVTAFDAAQLRVWVAPELLRGMVLGEERLVPILLYGVPELVAVETGTDVVTVRRVTDQEGGGDRRFQR
jgi:YbbR domain-containing protein